MKKKLSLLFIVIFTLCLVGFALDRLAPASPASAASEAHPVPNSAAPAPAEAAPSAPAAQPVIYVVGGLVCALFGIIAVSPLLMGDPARKT
jgi:hypothetical protein